MKDYSNIGLTQKLRNINSLSEIRGQEGLKEYIDDRIGEITRPGGLNYTNITAMGREYKAVVSLDKKLGNFDDIQNAVNYVNQLGGGDILIRAGTYFPGTTITLASNIGLIGEGMGQTVIDGSNIGGTSNIIFVQGTSLSNLGSVTITKDSTTVVGTATSFPTTLVKGDYLTAKEDTTYSYKYFFEVASRTNAGTLELSSAYQGLTLDTVAYSLIQPIKNISIENLSVVNGTALGNYGIRLVRIIDSKLNFVEVKNCQRDNLNLFIGNNLQVQNSIFRNAGSLYGLRVDLVSNLILNGVDSSNNNGNGILIFNGDDAQIIQCTTRFNGTTGIEVNSSYFVNIIGCNTERNVNGLNLSTSSQHIHAIGNMITDNTKGIIITGDYCKVSNNSIVDNATGISFNGLSGSAVVENNIFFNNTTTIGTAGTGNIIRNNFGYITENWGLGTVVNGATIGTIAHGLVTTPTNVRITPNTGWGSTTKFYVDTIGTANFNINVDTNPGADMVFSWEAMKV